METTEYFARPDTPAVGSPVGQLIVRILKKIPGTSFEDARAQANALLDKAAGRKIYSMPRVYSPEEQTARQAQFREFTNLRRAA
jgi:hypothetical protein